MLVAEDLDRARDAAIKLVECADAIRINTWDERLGRDLSASGDIASYEATCRNSLLTLKMNHRHLCDLLTDELVSVADIGISDATTESLKEYEFARNLRFLPYSEFLGILRPRGNTFLEYSGIFATANIWSMERLLNRSVNAAAYRENKQRMEEIRDKEGADAPGFVGDFFKESPPEDLTLEEAMREFDRDHKGEPRDWINRVIREIETECRRAKCRIPAPLIQLVGTRDQPAAVPHPGAAEEIHNHPAEPMDIPVVEKAPKKRGGGRKADPQRQKQDMRIYRARQSGEKIEDLVVRYGGTKRDIKLALDRVRQSQNRRDP